MPQHNGSNPTFNFSTIDEAIYEHHPYAFNDVYEQQWLSPGTPAVIPSAPSPTNTVRTNRSAPSRHVPQRNLQRAAKAVQQSCNLDPKLQHAQQSLPPLDTRQPIANQHNHEPILNPIALFYNQNEGPWNPFGGMRNSQDCIPQNNFLQTQVYHGQHRRGPCSDVGSNVPASDSGYYTHQTPSLLSNEPGNNHQELPAGLLDQTKNLNVDRSPVGSQPMVRRPSDQRSILSHHSNRSRGHKQLFPCREPGCSEVSKSASEQKKHMLKHEKNFICCEPDCKRAGKGFSTINDLDRHKKSVHKIGIDKSKSYLCAAPSCANKGKIWPRLDNFKQHIERMHKGEDTIELIRRSEYQANESLSVDPALLAGMGDPNDLLTSNTHGFPYQSSVSFHAGSTPSASGVSPSTASHDLSFSRSHVTPSTSGNFSASKDMGLPLPVENGSDVPFGRRRSTKGSPAGMPSVMTPMPSFTQNCGQMQLSTAPQTKSEQQKQALAKLAKTDMDIEEIVQRVLSAQQHQDGSSNPLVLSETEKLHASQAIVNLLKQKQKPKAVRPQQRNLTQGSASASGTKYCEFENCNFSGRLCDLNKHRKRHQKPYGCTYPKCHKRFGAKSDWKRHENSQHFQLEAFRCDHLNQSRQKCGQHCYRPIGFRKHLAEKHMVTSDTQAEASLKRCRIGKNCQGQFWCGFCKEIIPLQTKRNAAWDERFDHIASHFEKHNRPIDEWLCVEENKTKAQLKKEMDRTKFEDDEPMDADVEAMDNGESFTYETTSASAAHFDVQGTKHRDFSPREAGSSPRSHKRSKQSVRGFHSQSVSDLPLQPASDPRRQCCQCMMDSGIVQAVCFGCEHNFCDSCERVYVDRDEYAEHAIFG